MHLTVTRARVTGAPAVFRLGPERGCDAVFIDLVNHYLTDGDTGDPDIRVLNPVAATRLPLECARRGEDTISVASDMLRDYNMDLFLILELDTGAKMFSVVPLMNDGGLYETGAGSSAPKYVRQLPEKDCLR